MKSLCKSLTVWLLCLFFVFSNFIVSFADVKSLMIGSSSNAVSMFALPRSSVGTVTNTATGALVAVRYTNGTFNNASFITPQLVNDRWKFNFSIPDYLSGYWIDEVNFYFSSQASGFNALPSPPGNYLFSMDFASDFSYSLNPDSRSRLFSVYGPANAELEYSNIFLDPLFASGDFYISPMSVDFRTGYNNVRVRIFPSRDSNMKNFGGSYSVSFKMTDIDGAGLVGSDLSYGDVVQDQMSGQLSDLSSSVDSMADDLSSAAENLEYISTSQNLIIRGIDNVVMHISDQLFAFWNQLYNLIHVPTMAKMDDIISAIQNMDLEIDVNLDGLKQSIHQASQNEIANDNKVSADQIANNEANTEEVKDAVKEHGNFIIDGLKGLFIPSDEFFKAYFDDLYAYFSDRFGFLSFPIDLLIRTVNLFINSSDVDAVITLPSFEISGEQVWADQSFNFTEFMETNFAFLLAAIRTVTSIGMIYAFVNLCQDKWDEVMKS